MADADSYIKPRKLFSEVAPPSDPQNQTNPSKSYSHFLFKALLITVFLVILPLFPSEPPEFLNQTILTRSWELIHLLFVGIAVSYGLFSRRNVETAKEIQSKTDNPQHYMSRILQVSSFFDDEVESPSGSVWNSRYLRGGPVIVVSQEDSVLDDLGHTSTDRREKPLLLPVRSLKSRITESDATEFVIENGGSLGSLSGSGSSLNSSSNGSNKSMNREIRGLDPLELGEKLKGTVVPPSPIPWRSRSGMMELQEAVDTVTPLNSFPPSVEEPVFDQLNSQSFRSPVSLSSHPILTSSSPKFSPSPSLSPELRGKSMEDLGNSFYESDPIPSLQLTTPISRKCPTITSNSSPWFSSEKKEVKRDFEEELKGSAVLQSPFLWQSRSGGMEMQEEMGTVTPLYSFPSSVEECEFDQLNSRSFQSPASLSSRPISTSSSPMLSPSPSLSPKLRGKSAKDLGTRKSFYKSDSIPSSQRTTTIHRKSPSIASNSSPIDNEFSSEKEEVKINSKEELKNLSRSSRGDLESRRNSGLGSLKAEAKPRSHIEGSSIGKSVRTIRAREPVGEVRKSRDFSRDQMEGKTGERSKEFESVMLEKAGRKTGCFDQPLMATEKTSPSSFSNNQKEEKKEFVENVTVVSEEDIDSGADDVEGIADIEEAASNILNDSGADPNEVDKKAEEFIAKFREQIRLQRIAAIKRSSGQLNSRNPSR